MVRIARGLCAGVLAGTVLMLGATPAVAGTAGSQPVDPSSSSAQPSGRSAQDAAITAAVPDPEAITFDEFSLGTTITDEYADRGVVFTSDVFLSADNDNPTEPVLSGTPLFFGDIVGQFTVPGTTTPATVNGFSLDVGYINNRNSVEIVYYDPAGNVVGTTRAQSYGINSIDAFYRGVASFRVRAIEYEAAGFAIDNLVIHRGAVGTRPTRMAAFGDSYSSGEGLLKDDSLRYDCGTDLHEGRYFEGTTLAAGDLFWTKGEDCQTANGSYERPGDLLRRSRVKYHNLCHRHGRAYPNQIRERLGLAPENAIFVACSGAKTKNLGAGVGPEAQYPSSPAGVHGGKSQLDTVSDFAAGGQPDLVTVGIGGNDAGFGQIIVECIVHDCTELSFASSVISTINGSAFGNIRTTFENLRSKFGGATIVAFGYPSIIDDPAHWCSGFLSVDAEERTWLKTAVLPTINEAIEDAADDAGVVYVDITSVTAGHGVCSSDEWINGARLGDDSWYRKGNESFHPNQKAHDAIASFFIDHYTDGNGQLLVRNPEPAAPIRPPVGNQIALGEIDVGAARKCGADCLQPAACIQVCGVHVEGDGFAPGVTMGAVLQSDPVSLGQATTDANGRIDAWFQLPPGVEPGLHSVTLDGTAADGTRQHAVQLLDVFGRLSARLKTRFAVGREGTEVRSLAVKGVPPGARVQIACGGNGKAVTRSLAGGRVKRRAGCPFARRTMRARKVGRKGKVGAALKLAVPFKAPLRTGAVVRLVVTQGGFGGRTFDLQIRRAKRPKIVRRCTEPGLIAPVRC